MPREVREDSFSVTVTEFPFAGLGRIENAFSVRGCTALIIFGIAVPLRVLCVLTECAYGASRSVVQSIPAVCRPSVLGWKQICIDTEEPALMRAGRALVSTV